MNPPEITLRCFTCQRTYSPEALDYTCPACGPLLGTLDVLYDYPSLRKRLRRETFRRQSRADHWRYLPLLPVRRPEFVPSLQVGWTPLYRARALESAWGVGEIHVKDDGRNPTASFKDRASSVAVVKAREKGVRAVTAASTGNAASSWSAFTALAGLETNIFVPENAPRAKVAQLLLYGARVIQVRGTYDDAFDLCGQAAAAWGWYNRSTAINPYLGEGKKTGALEICEQLDWQVPDYVFVAVGDGCILQGTWKGFKDFYEVGLIERLPKLVGVQAEGAAPLVLAWQSGAERCEPLTPRTLADSIAVGVPRDQVKALRAVRESGGQFVAVSDEEILAAMRTLARSVGVFAEPAGATALAGLKRLAEAGVCGSKTRVVVLVTGNGLKDIEGAMQAATAEPVLVENSLADVERRLAENQGSGDGG